MNSKDRLRKKILAEVEKQLKQGPTLPEQKRARALGLFLIQCLRDLNLSRDDFARALDMERELADAILDGVLPVSEIDQTLLESIASIIGCRLDLLQTFL
jgi:hypothetical protein